MNTLEDRSEISPQGPFSGRQAWCGVQDQVIPSLNNDGWSPTTWQAVCCVLGIPKAVLSPDLLLELSGKLWKNVNVQASLVEILI